MLFFVNYVKKVIAFGVRLSTLDLGGNYIFWSKGLPLMCLFLVTYSP